jgi:hypothetical protein
MKPKGPQVARNTEKVTVHACATCVIDESLSLDLTTHEFSTALEDVMLFTTVKIPITAGV